MPFYPPSPIFIRPAFPNLSIQSTPEHSNYSTPATSPPQSPIGNHASDNDNYVRKYTESTTPTSLNLSSEKKEKAKKLRMATYATYYHFPSANPMVHANPHQSLTAPSTYPAVPLSLQSAESHLLKLAASDKLNNNINSTMSSPQRLTLPPCPKKAINPQKTSLFFRLPAELRNTIYNELLCPDTLRLRDLAIRDKDLSVRGFNQTSTPATLFPQILSTCKKIHDEAIGLLYATHVFHAHPSLLTSLPHLSSPSSPVLYPQVTSLIRRWQVSIRLDTDPRFTYAQVTAAFSNAEFLQVHVWQAQYDSCDYSVLRLFTGVRGVVVARVGGSVDPELAAWLEERMMGGEEPGMGCECVDEQGDACMWEARREVLCGRCYRKVGAGDWLDEVREEVWRFGGGAR